MAAADRECEGNMLKRKKKKKNSESPETAQKSEKAGKVSASSESAESRWEEIENRVVKDNSESAARDEDFVDPRIRAKQNFHRELRRVFRIELTFIIIIWAVWILDTAVFSGRLQGYGIQPRTAIGLAGIITAPFLHASFAHILNNTIGFVLLASLVLFIDINL